MSKCDEKLSQSIITNKLRNINSLTINDQNDYEMCTK